MSEPWLDDLDEKRQARRGCGCSTRAKLILAGIVLALVLVCLVGYWLSERYRDRQKIELRTPPPPPRTTPVKVFPGGAAATPTCTPSAARPHG
jgi:hypothetical protein